MRIGVKDFQYSLIDVAIKITNLYGVKLYCLHEIVSPSVSH